MPKKMTPRPQAKIKPQFLQYPVFTIFNLKESITRKKYIFLSLNRIIRI